MDLSQYDLATYQAFFAIQKLQASQLFLLYLFTFPGPRAYFATTITPRKYLILPRLIRCVRDLMNHQKRLYLFFDIDLFTVRLQESKVVCDVSFPRL